jgi:hypothetical protein
MPNHSYGNCSIDRSKLCVGQDMCGKCTDMPPERCPWCSKDYDGIRKPGVEMRCRFCGLWDTSDLNAAKDALLSLQNKVVGRATEEEVRELLYDLRQSQGE